MFVFGNYIVVIMSVMGTILAYRLIDEKVENKFYENILNEHNKYRKIHGSRCLKFDDYTMGLVWTPMHQMLNGATVEEHSICGVNTYSIEITNESEINAELAKKVVAYWYEKGTNYNYLDEPQNNDADEFTQIVWRESRKFGIHIVMTTEGKLYVVAAYLPKGNIKEEYKNNVKEPINPQYFL